VAARILLTDDNESLVKVLKKVLAGIGFDVVTARNGLEALQALSAGRIDLILLDLNLPILNGVDLLRKIRTTPNWAVIPVIIMSGAYKGPKYAEAARRLGVHHYLEKPFTRSLFLETVRRVLKGTARQKKSGIFHLLVEIYNTRESGLLTITGGPLVSFINGEPFSFLSRNREDFPVFLAAKGKIGLDDVRHFTDSGEERLFLTQSGLLTYEELLEESRIFLVKSLMDAMAMDKAADFAAGHPDAPSPLIPLSLPHLMYETVKTHGTHFSDDQFLGNFSRRFPARSTLFYRRINLTTLRKEDINLLGLVNGVTTLGEILERGKAGREGAFFFQFLHDLGMIRFHDGPESDAHPDFPLKNLFNRPLEELPDQDEMALDFHDLVEEISDDIELVMGDDGMAAPLSDDEISFEQAVQREYAVIKDKNYYEIFGLTPGTFSFNALKDAYFEKTRRYSPEKFMEITGATMNIAQEVLSHYANAYSTLSSVVAKERYDELLNAEMSIGIDGRQDDRLQARIQLESGNAFLQMGEFENAEKALQDAYTLAPDNPMSCALLAWAIYRNPANKNSRASIDKAKMLLGRSLQNGKCAEAYAYRGWLLLEEGRDGLAEGEFQKALRLNPKEPVARKGLQMVEEKRESDKKGLFRKIFG
jgi:CheY-like chemotaxis protein/Flp pilus assembly protein TadD